MHRESWSPLVILREVAAVTLDVGRRFGLLCGNPNPLYSASFYRLYNLVEVGLCVSSSLLMGLRRNSAQSSSAQSQYMCLEHSSASTHSSFSLPSCEH